MRFPLNMLRSLAALAAVAPVVVAACEPAADVTYHEDVAPLLNTQCVACHQEGGIAPLPLTTYAEVAPLADLIATVTRARLMPPTIVDASGSCGDFKNARWLSDAELDLLQAWAAGGAVEGTPPQTPPALATPDALTDADAFVELETPYTPKPSTEHPEDDYRCFIVDAGFTEDRYLTGMEIFPGDRAEVHHMILFALLSDEAEAQAAQVDADEPGEGFTCFSTPVESSDILVLTGWAPGADVVRYPEGTGLFIPGGRKLVMQMHYNLKNGARPDQTRVALRTTASVAAEGVLVPLMDDEMLIPAGQTKATITFSQPLAGLPDDFEVHGVFPHMHQLGRTMRFDVHPLNDPEEAFCMADVPRWDFHWQQVFFYESPVKVGAGDVVRVSCTYDTSSRTEDVPWGEGTSDEMCLVFAYLTRLGGGSLQELIE